MYSSACYVFSPINKISERRRIILYHTKLSLYSRFLYITHHLFRNPNREQVHEYIETLLFICHTWSYQYIIFYMIYTLLHALFLEGFGITCFLYETNWPVGKIGCVIFYYIYLNLAWQGSSCLRKFCWHLQKIIP